MICPNHVYIPEALKQELLEYYECPACGKPLAEHGREIRDDMEPGMIYVVDPRQIRTELLP
jgi:hypothetical protein